jgi:triosephosphate isomerase (TIM)
MRLQGRWHGLGIQLGLREAPRIEPGKNRNMSIRPLVAGNWKMNGLAASIEEAKAVAESLKTQAAAAEVAICPPATLIAQLAWNLRDTEVAVGGQDCRAEEKGAFTGDIAAEQLKDAGANLVILGHSERRAGHGETSEDVAAKVEAAVRAGLRPIVCVGETLEEREAGWAVAVVSGQVEDSLPEALQGKAFAVAYEPVWAIGSGLTPTVPQIEEIHTAIRAVLVRRFGEAGAGAPILYGGSVKPSNADEIMKAAEVGGALVGGASLKAADFLPIIRAAG